MSLQVRSKLSTTFNSSLNSNPNQSVESTNMGPFAKFEKEKLAITFLFVFLLLGTLLVFTVQLDHIPKQTQFAVNPQFRLVGNNAGYRREINIAIDKGTNTDSNITKYSAQEFKVDWFPPRYWTQQSKYSAVVKNGPSHPGSQMHGTLETQRAIWLHQHPPTCHDKKFLIFEALADGHGIGSVLHVTGVMLLAAMNLNRILVLKPQPNYEWVQGQFCTGTDTLDECYFEPLSSCTINDAFGRDTDVSPENFLKFPEISQATYASNSDRVLRGTVRNPNISPAVNHGTPSICHAILERGNISTNFYYWWRAQSVAYIVRPTLRTLKELDRRRETLFEGKLIEPGTISIHVRHGDKWKEARLEPDSSYLRSAEALIADHSEQKLQRKIFLSTEDPNTVEFFAKLGNWSVEYTNVLRVGDPKVGPEDFAKKIGWDEEFLNSLLSLQLALECDGFVGALVSNWNRLIDELRSTVRSKHHRVFVDVTQGYYPRNFGW